MQDGDATYSYTINHSINVLNEMLEQKMVRGRLWSARSPELNLVIFMWGNLKYKANPGEWNNLFKRPKVSLRAERIQYGHLL
jgi:hypothetical protein